MLQAAFKSLPPKTRFKELHPFNESLIPAFPSVLEKAKMKAVNTERVGLLICGKQRFLTASGIFDKYKCLFVFDAYLGSEGLYAK